ncbi:MAG: hypothetical protein JWO57_885, partial [Pseudonocardiales bacterium]|nr:hypothetical protein [Pseudonocardiales bacterium]
MWASVGLVGLVVVAGCSGGGSSTSSSGRSAPGALAPQPAANSEAGGGAAAGSGAPNYKAPAGGSSAQLIDAPALIRTVDLVVRVARPDDVAGQANRAGHIVTSVGGRIDSDDRTSGDHATAALILKVPPDSLASVLAQLAALGKEVSRSSSTKDVTQQVVDVTSRVRSAELAISQLNALFRQATKLGDIITLERELSQREADLESLQAQKRSLDAQTSMATVTLELTSQPAPAPAKHRERSGFTGGLARGWDAFTAAA